MKKTKSDGYYHNIKNYDQKRTHQKSTKSERSSSSIRKTCWRLLGLATITTFLIVDLHLTITGHNVNPGPFLKNPTERLSMYYSYFTTQTNYLVLIYLFGALLQKVVKPKSEPNFYILLAVTVYISITMIVFWTGIITNQRERHKYGYDIYLWFKTIILHLIMPIVMITNFFYVTGKKYYNLKEHHHLYFWFILFYPIFYLIVVLIRGTLRYNEGAKSGTCFPYFFLNYKVNGIWMLVAAIVIIFLIVIFLQYFYLYINNWRFKKTFQIMKK